MAADSDGTLKAVVICEGDLHDPEFPKKFRVLLGKLNSILDPPKRKKRLIKVNKVEPWNSVRVTLSIPKDAASKLRQLAAEGSTALRALGILSVQLEGDTVISLRLVGQEIVLRAESENGQTTTGNQDSNSFGEFVNMLSRVPTPLNNQQQSPVATVAIASASASSAVVAATATVVAVAPFVSIDGPSPSSGIAAIKPSTSSNSLLETTSILTNGPIDANKPLFKSPNTVCPMDGKLPTPVPSNVADATREYPFESMTQARVIHRRENTLGAAVTSPISASTSSIANPFGSPPPPPYPSVSPTQTILPSGGKPSQNLNIASNKMPLHASTVAPASGNIAISSPLLVNLLQNESASSSANLNTAKMTPQMTSNLVSAATHIHDIGTPSTANHALQRQQSISRQPINKISGIDNNNKQQLHQIQLPLSQNPQQQMRVQQQQLFVAGETTAMPSQQQQQQQQFMLNNNNNNNHNINSSSHNNNNNNMNMNMNNTNNSARSIINSSNNVLSTQNAIIAGSSAPMSVPSPLNVNVNKMQSQSRFPPQQPQPHQTLVSPQPQQQQLLSPHPQQYHPQFQPQIRPSSNMMANPSGIQLSPGLGPSSHSSQLHMKQLQSPHHQQQYQQQFANQTQIRSNASMMSPQMLHTMSTPIQQHQQMHMMQQQQQQQQQQHQHHQIQPSTQNIDQNDLAQSTYNPRWPLKPMDSATKSSFQEFTRYQMQYNLSQQQHSTPAPVDPLPFTDQLADLDEIATLESLLPTLNDSDLDIDIKAPLDDLVLDLIDPSMATDPNANAVGVITQQAPTHPTTPTSTTSSGGGVGVGTGVLTTNVRRMTSSMTAIQNYPQTDILQTHLQQNMPAMMQTYQSNVDPKSKLIGGSGGKSNSSGGGGGGGGGKEKQFLINPLTGELEPIPSDDEGDEARTNAFTELSSEISNSMYSDDENSCSTGLSKTTPDHSDNERSSNSETSQKGKTVPATTPLMAASVSNKQQRKERKDSTKKVKMPREKTTLKNSLLKEKLQQGLKEKILSKTSGGGGGGGGSSSGSTSNSGKLSAKDKKLKTIASPIISNATIAESGDKSCPEKIKLRLKLEKSEPVTAAYKIDVSFGQSPKRAQSSPTTAKIVASTSATGAGSSATLSQTFAATGATASTTSAPTNSEELRVPPLHISLRGRNSVVIQNSKKDRKKSQSVGDGGNTRIKVNDVMTTTVTTTALATVINDGIDPMSSPQNRLSYTNSTTSNEIQTPVTIATATGTPAASIQSGDRTKTSSVTISTLQKIKHKTSDDVNDKTIVRIVAKNEPKAGQQENGERVVVEHQQNDALKRSSTDTTFASNGSVCPEKKRRLSQTLLNASASTIDTAAMASSSASASTITLSSTSSSSPSSEHATIQVTTAMATATATTTNKITIGSTNVGTLPQHSSLLSSKIQKSNINNNNSATFNKVKSVSKLKSKTLITMLKQHSGRTIGPNKNITVVVTPKPTLTTTPPSTTTNTLTVTTMPAIKTNALAIVTSAPTALDPSHRIATDSSAKPELNCTTSADRVEEYNSENARRNASDPIALPPMTKEAQNTHNASQLVRCSPGSQAQGEDSGIESMDALSEKSPHQSASPQAIDAKHTDGPKELPAATGIKATATTMAPTIPPTKEPAAVLNDGGYVDIEAALAKMEGLNEYMTSVCDKGATVVSVATCDERKVNGDHSSHDDKISRLVDDLVSSTKMPMNALIQGDASTKTVTKVDAPTIDDKLQEVIESETECKSSSLPAANETKVRIENCLPPESGIDVKIEIKKCTNAVAASLNEELIKQLKDEVPEYSPHSPIILVTTSTESVKTISMPIEAFEPVGTKAETIKCEEDIEIENAMSKSNILLNADIIGGDANESSKLLSTSASGDATMLQQLSIEIPSGENDNMPRVCTRASSKLESPLEIPKQSPADSPASGSVKSMKLSTAAIERLSPKTAAGKGQKRKRQGSESSSQSSISDDTPIRGKKTRRIVSDVSPSTSSASTPTPLSTTNSTMSSSTKSISVKRTAENHKSNSSSSSPTNCKQSPSPTGHANLGNFNSNDIDHGSNKVEDSSDSDEPLIEMLGKARNAKVCKIVLEADKVVRNHNTSSATSKNQINTNHQQQQQLQQNHATGIQTAQLKSANTANAKSDDKTCTISTRRSVRMTLNASTTKGTSKAGVAHNNHSLTTLSTHSTATHTNDVSEMIRKSGNGQHIVKHNSIIATTIGSMAAADSSAPNSMDARRKTRSAGLETLTEGRRRRLSRDTK